MKQKQYKIQELIDNMLFTFIVYKLSPMSEYGGCVGALLISGAIPVSSTSNSSYVLLLPVLLSLHQYSQSLKIQ